MFPGGGRPFHVVGDDRQDADVMFTRHRHERVHPLEIPDSRRTLHGIPVEVETHGVDAAGLHEFQLFGRPVILPSLQMRADPVG